MERRKVTYRLYPSKTQATALADLLRHHQQLYNACLEQRIDAWRRAKVSVSYADQCAELTALRRECPDWAVANCSSQQITLRRLNKAFQAFFRRVKAGQTPGFPRFKSLKRFPGFGFKGHGDGWRFTPGADWRHGKLRLQGVGLVKARGQPRQGGTIKSCELMHKDGVWHLSLTLECPVIQRRHGAESCAFDWGTETFLTLAVKTADADAHETVANPRWFQTARDRLGDLARSVSRKKRGSNRRRKATKTLAREKRRVANRRKDWQHKISAALIARFGLIAAETLSIQNLTRSAAGTVEEPGSNVKQKSGLNREILDTAPAQFYSMVRYKAADAGSLFLEAPTRALKPSQRCPCCWSVVKKALGERTHTCSACGHKAPRDFTSARVVLRWAHDTLTSTGQELSEAA